MKNLKTGEMLDKLGLRDTAINEKGWHVGYDDKGNLLTWDEGEDKPDVSDGNAFSIVYHWMKESLWEIRPHYVSFEEAMTAHYEEKKTISFFQKDDLVYRFEYGEYGQFQGFANDGYSLKDVAKEQWVIEG